MQQRGECGLGRHGAFERNVRGDTHERAFELAHVRADALGDEIEHPTVERDIEVGLLAAQDGDARLKIRHLDLRGEAPLKAGDEAAFEILDLARRTIAGEHDLARVVEELVEGVEELLLRAVLALEEVHVVDQQHVHLAVFLAELREGLLLDRFHELIRELLARDVAHDGVALPRDHFLADSLEQVRLAEAGGAVEEERVVDLAGLFSDRLGHSDGVTAVGADDEAVEVELRVETHLRKAAHGLRLRRSNACGLGLRHHRRFQRLRASGRLCCHGELDRRGLAGDLRHRIGDHAEIIALNPQLMNRIGHGDDETATIRGMRGGTTEAALIIVRAEALQKHLAHTIPECGGQRKQVVLIFRRLRRVGRKLAISVDLHWVGFLQRS